MLNSSTTHLPSDAELQEMVYGPSPDMDMNRPLMERDFNRAVMHPENRRAADKVWDLQEREDIDPTMFDKMNEEQPNVRNQVAEVRNGSETPAFAVTREQVAGWSTEYDILRNGQISKAIVAMRNKELVS